MENKKLYRINVRANYNMVSDLKDIRKFLELVGDKDNYSDSEVLEIVLDFVNNMIKEKNISPL